MWFNRANEEPVNNTIFYNYFVENSLQGQDMSRFTNWDNGTVGNYWSDYAGIDGDGDGIGDTPHEINSDTGDNNSVDRYPLMDIPTKEPMIPELNVKIALDYIFVA